MLKYKACPTLPQGGLDIGLKVGILAEIGYMLQECALSQVSVTSPSDWIDGHIWPLEAGGGCVTIIWVQLLKRQLIMCKSQFYVGTLVEVFTDRTTHF